MNPDDAYDRMKQDVIDDNPNTVECWPCSGRGEWNSTWNDGKALRTVYHRCPMCSGIGRVSADAPLVTVRVRCGANGWFGTAYAEDGHVIRSGWGSTEPAMLRELGKAHDFNLVAYHGAARFDVMPVEREAPKRVYRARPAGMSRGFREAIKKFNMSATLDQHGVKVEVK